MELAFDQVHMNKMRNNRMRGPTMVTRSRPSRSMAELLAARHGVGSSARAHFSVRCSI